MTKLTDYKVHILPEVYDKIMFWVDKSKVEVSGFGRVHFIGNIPTVTEAYLVDQENSSTETDIDSAALAKLMYETREDEGHLNFWWHSHVNMAVYWSGTDYAAIEQLGSAGWILSTVFNKKRETRTSIYQAGSEFFPPIWTDGIKLELAKTVDEAKVKAWEEEFDKKCKTKTYPVAKSWGNYPSYSRKWCPTTGKWIDDIDKDKNSEDEELSTSSEGYLLLLKDLSAKEHPLVFAMKPHEREELTQTFFEVYGEVPYHWDDLEMLVEDIDKHGLAQLKYWETRDASLLTFQN